MMPASREFQVMVKPVGAVCNLDCGYCYYLQKKELYPGRASWRMADDVLERYIVQHIEACPTKLIFFSWHGGEPTLLGLDYFRRIVELEQKHRPPGRQILNGIQTNGTLLDDDWCRFLAAKNFQVGISIDGPKELHDRYRISKGGEATHKQVMQAFRLLQKYGVHCDVLCVVHDRNVRQPAAVYRFFKEIGVEFLQFLPVVARPDQPARGDSLAPRSGERVGVRGYSPRAPTRGITPSPDLASLGRPLSRSRIYPTSAALKEPNSGKSEFGAQRGEVTGTASDRPRADSVSAEAFGEFLCAIFDEWVRRDIGRIHIQLFVEAERPFLGQEHALCLFRESCGDVVVVEHNGDFYACDHFVDPGHRIGNIRESSLLEMLESADLRAFGRRKSDLPRYCRDCEVLGSCNGGCPKDRFCRTPDGEEGLNYLCAGYKRFFTHSRPYLQQMASLRKSGDSAERLMQLLRSRDAEAASRIGRNDPCPCGSGKKYKKCCLGKVSFEA